MIGYFFRPECGKEDRIGPVFGPYPEFFQLTYEDLRTGEDGAMVMHYSSRHDWVFAGANDTWDPSPLPAGWENSSFSDVVLWAEEMPDGTPPRMNAEEATEAWWISDPYTKPPDD